MRAIADALTDWLDADTTALPLGAEDGAYAGLAQPYRTGGVMLAEVSELRAVKGVDADDLPPPAPLPLRPADHAACRR